MRKRKGKWVWSGLFLAAMASGVAGWISTGGASGADEYQTLISPPQEVAAKAAGARAQTQAAVAWSAGAKSWLVAWREGCLNEGSTEIWCARVGEDGQSLDPAGIRLAYGKGLRSYVSVASDGQNWLVVWGELSNGRDWDVRGIVVSAEGKPQGEPFLIAGGEHNQCEPAAAFAGGHYHVVWSAFVGSGLPNTPGNGYAIYGARVSPQGKLVDATPTELVSNKAYQAAHPSIASGGDVLAVTFVEQRHNRFGGTVINWILLDAKTGARKHGPLPPTSDARKSGRGLGGKVTARWLPVAWNGSSFVTSVRMAEGFGGGSPYVATLWTLSPDGAFQTTRTALDGLEQARVSYLTPHTAVAFDGEHFLYVMENAQDAKEPKGVKGQGVATHMCIAGWYVSPDGTKIVCGRAKGGFKIAAEPGKEHILPAVSAGPQGVCLVVNSELRGVEDIKLVARRVSLKKASP